MSEPLIALAKGADILVSEVNDLEQSYQALRAAFGGSDEQLRGPLEHMRHEHLTPEQVGDIARRAGVKFVVLTHIGISDGRETDMRRYTEGVRKTFSGPVVVAHDGDEF